MTDLDQRVLDETLRLEAAMPSLLKGHAGKWVVFRDGVAHSFHDDFEAAFRAAIHAFGVDGGQVIAQIAERGAHSLSRAAHRIIQS